MHNYIKAEISSRAIRENIARIKKALKPGVKLCAVIKCNAYGHGQDLLWPLIARYVDFLGVATPAEALHLRDAGYDGPMLVFFSACAKAGEGDLGQTLDELLRKRVTLTITSRWELDVLTQATRRTGCDAKVHLAVDTGMTRSGAMPASVAGLVQEIRLDPSLKLTGIYTHLATADETNQENAIGQLNCFDQVVSNCSLPADQVIIHAANSAGAIFIPRSQYDMIRPGIAIYGYQPSDEMIPNLTLKPALRLCAHIMQIKRVRAGTACGYGLTARLDRDSVVGLVPVGYGDGYMRSLSNKAVMRIRNMQAPVLGRISMDQTILDLTDLPEVNVGDQVEIISPDPSQPNSVENLAKLANTIPYEIICRLGRRVRRSLVD